MHTHEQHKKHAPATIRVAVVTVSDTRTPETDESGRVLRDLLADAGHDVVRSEILPDEAPRIVRAAAQAIEDASIDAVVFTGGTGAGPRDVTVEALRPLLHKELPGFGELFRMLSFQEIGSAAILSRALAGVAHRTVVIALPGSAAAVRLAMERLVVPELGHLVSEVRGREGHRHAHHHAG
jgi:molybdenum cofactor biosynthesis protein B